MTVITYEAGERAYEKYTAYLDRQGTGCDSWGDLTEDDRAAWAEVELPEPYIPPPAARAALEQLAATWDAEAAVMAGDDAQVAEAYWGHVAALRGIIGGQP